MPPYRVSLFMCFPKVYVSADQHTHTIFHPIAFSDVFALFLKRYMASMLVVFSFKGLSEEIHNASTRMF